MQYGRIGKEDSRRTNAPRHSFSENQKCIESSCDPRLSGGPKQSALLSRSSSSSTLKPDWEGVHHPSLSDLGSFTDLSGKFRSLTARKLMAGLSSGSIDTLIEVTSVTVSYQSTTSPLQINNAANNNNNYNNNHGNMETIDLGVI
jgi:hypothetical protein